MLYTLHGTGYKRAPKQLHAYRRQKRKIQDKGERHKRKEKDTRQSEEINKEKEMRVTAALNFALITFMSIWSYGLQAPILSSENSVIMQTNGTHYVFSSCPNYEQGNPSQRNMTGCETGTSLEDIDHEKAFGFDGGENPDWKACGLPRVPEEK